MKPGSSNFIDEGQTPHEKGSLKKGTAGGVGKSAQKKESRIEGKPGPLCGKCPLREQPFVGGGLVRGEALYWYL